MTRIIPSLLISLVLASAPAHAGYPEAKASFEGLSRAERSAVTLGLIAAGTFEGLAALGFTPYLYRAIRAFERRHGMNEDGVLAPEQVQQLARLADDFYHQLGARSYRHPHTGARLLVPRGLFDSERQTAEGLLFTRRDGMLSLAFLSFPGTEKSYDRLWKTLSAATEGKHIVYERRFDNRFVVTGVFHQSKFYTMMARDGANTTGFTISWGAPYEALGRKLSTFLANAWLAEIR
ncbi:peptidoglycan-binding domain-containing protein [Aestuariivirga litoralis]|uniref:peptidoglycan-binding domain-containing protein n=1 Tax=Aestuariivirga litoralis TaxID=2650924 RepID=UPI0011B74D46|nr:peptidoglycan-binding domain-containing protein [Aestuariivirga litoralis]